jgi:hypothetical protein
MLAFTECRTQPDNTIVTVHDALGEPTIQSAWESGQRLMIKEAVKLALKEN